MFSFDMSNTLIRCIENNQISTANILIKFCLDQDRSINLHSQLTSILKCVLESNNPMKEYLKFFVDRDDDNVGEEDGECTTERTTNFFYGLLSKEIGKFSNKSFEETQICQNGDHMGIEKVAVKTDFQPGDIPVHFFIVSLRAWVIQKKLADPKFFCDHVDNVMLSELLLEIMHKYPNDIEEMHAIVAYIDGEFENKSSYLMKIQFYIFFIGYFIPIVMQ